VATVNTSLAGKANLAGGNTFSGTQALALLSGGGAQASNLFRLNSTDGTTPQSVQLQARTDGGLSFQFGPTAGTIAEKLSIDKTGKITFATGQTFPAASFNGTLAIANGGTGATTASTALSNLGGATAASITGATNTKITYNSQGIVTGGTAAQFTDIAGSVASAQLPKATISALGAIAAPVCVSGHYSSVDGNGNLVCTADASSTGPAGGQITITGVQASGANSKNTCTTTDPTFPFNGVSNTMAIVITPAGPLNAVWNAAGVSWVPYFSSANTVGVHVCNANQANLSFTASQTFNVRFIN
jgi:hypothetical protein